MKGFQSPGTAESAVGLPPAFEAVGKELSELMAKPTLPRETVTFRSAGVIANPPAALVALNDGRRLAREQLPRGGLAGMVTRARN